MEGAAILKIRRQLGITPLLHSITNSNDSRKQAGKINQGEGRSQWGEGREEDLVELERGLSNLDIFTTLCWPNQIRLSAEFSPVLPTCNFSSRLFSPQGIVLDPGRLTGVSLTQPVG